MTRALYRLGKIFATHKWIVLAVWIAIIAGSITWANTLNAELRNDNSVPGTNAQTAQDILNADFQQIAGTSATIVFRADPGQIIGTDQQQYVSTVLQGVSSVENVDTVTNPYQVVNNQTPNISQDSTTALATVYYTPNFLVNSSTTDELSSKINSYASAGEAVNVTAIPGGNAYFTTANSDANDKSSEIIGISVAVVILLIAFGSVIAMGLSLLSAGFGLGVGLSLIYVLANWLDISSVGPTVATMIGLGVGIDYSLFIINRYRENKRDGFDKIEAIGRAIGTAGQAVVVAGLTVIAALLGLFLIDIPTISSIAYSSAITVAVAILVANTLLPALLSISSKKIEKINVHRLFGRSGFDISMAKSWGETVTKHPLKFVIGALIVYAILIIPAKSIELGPPGENTIPPDNSQRIAYNIITSEFGVGYNGPILLVEQIPSGQSQQQVQASINQVTQSIQSTDGVAAVTFPSFNSDSTVAVQAVIPTTSFSSVETEDLVNNLQNNVIPSASQGTELEITTGGFTATFIDMAEKIKDKMPIFIGTVILFAFLLLVVVFRSILVPLIAAFAITLSALATFGVMVAIFQWGWGQELIGLDSTGQLVSYVPIMIFAILFGLTMDYEIFLVSRIREAYLESGNNKKAIIMGLAKSGRIIIVAALIMFSVFASFNSQFSAVIKMFGTGLAAAILIDVFLARLILVPALMTLGKDKTWAFPKWLSWIPDLHFEDSSVLDKKSNKKSK